VNEFSQTSLPNIYAVGDVTDRVNLTPVAIREAQNFADTVFGNKPSAVDHSCVPSAVFSHPPMCGVGLTESQARNALGSIKVYTSDFRPMKNVLAGRNERSLYKAYALCEERGTDAQAVADDLFGPGFDLNTLTGGRPGTASKMITKMFSMPRTDGGGTTPQKFVPEAGVYRVGEDRIRVKFSKHGNWYASRWNPALYNPWEYIGKRIDLRDAVRLNDEEVNA
jgi:hypothetical protein